MDASDCLGASFADCDPYFNLPILTVNGNSVVVGTNGGHIEFSTDIVLDVPGDAVDADTLIQASVVEVPAEMAGLGSPLIPVVQLLPDGLSFRLPARLQLSMPPHDINDIAMVASQPGDPFLDDIAIKEGANGSLLATIWHFTSYGIFGTQVGNLLVGDISVCNTTQARGLSTQIAAIFQQLAPGNLVPIQDQRVTTSDPLGSPLLQPTVVKDILSALNDLGAPSVKKVPFEITSGWRSLAQQYILANCKNGNNTAPPGTSNHADGSAFDLHGSYSKADACVADNSSLLNDDDYEAVRDKAHPYWGKLLEKGGNILWYGSEIGTSSICGDPPHFDDVSANSVDLRSTSVLAFQRLWNNRNPCDLLDEDGLFGPKTEDRLANSPAAGFQDIGPIQLPTNGLQGAGCDPNAGTPICCPGASPTAGSSTTPSCQVSCCNPNTCPGGCCDSQGTCQVGTDDHACGSGGQSCTSCAGSDTCGGGGVAGACGSSLGCTFNQFVGETSWPPNLMVSSAVCILRSGTTSAPNLSAPAFGPGYAMQAIPFVCDYWTLQTACTTAIYQSLLAQYCQTQSAPVSPGILGFRPDGAVAFSGGQCCEFAYADGTPSGDCTCGSPNANCLPPDDPRCGGLWTCP
jgi:hypothetical protein